MRLCGLALALLELLLFIKLVDCLGFFGLEQGESYQSLHGAVKSMSVVSAELGVGSLEGRVSRSLGLLDARRS